MSAKPCPACGPRHDLDAVTCTRCGHTEPLPEALDPTVAVVDALERLREDVERNVSGSSGGPYETDMGRVVRASKGEALGRIDAAIAAATEGGG